MSNYEYRVKIDVRELIDEIIEEELEKAGSFADFFGMGEIQNE